MHYLHSVAHIVHRDLKPENILLSENGACLELHGSLLQLCNTLWRLRANELLHLTWVPGNPKICDFGMSVGEANNVANGLCGTPGYIAPEVIIATVRTA